MKKSNEDKLGMLKYFLDTSIQVYTNTEQHSEDEDGNMQSAMLAYQGVLMDYDDKFLVLGYYDTDDTPVIVAMVSLNVVVAIAANEDADVAEFNFPKSEVN